MNIALLGYGRMGREVEHAARERHHTISAVFNSAHPLANSTSHSHLAGTDCCVDFSTAAIVPHHIRTTTALRIPLVVGTTGWNTHFDELKHFVVEHDGAILYASNFSIGAQIFFRAVTTAAALLDRFPGYDIAIHEIHHSMKKDAPSGTALALAEKILAHVQRKRTINTSPAAKPESLTVSSTRVGTVAGTHSVIMNSPADTIELTHTAHNRSGFALGAVMAAEWLQGKHGVFTMEDFLFSQSAQR
ncbi:MAG: 4-hydroxy-tetrahydrodipicolinate reductase [Bacteroidota bacterium]|nr:4-hydroxy-tetrahydrodipicolinate reductase [Bacteroidota bacterium]